MENISLRYRPGLPLALNGVRLEPGRCHSTFYAVIDCRFLGIYTVILLSTATLLSFSARMTVGAR